MANSSCAAQTVIWMHHLDASSPPNRFLPSLAIYCYHFSLQLQREPSLLPVSSPPFSPFRLTRQRAHLNVYGPKMDSNFLKQPTQKLREYFAETDNKTLGRRIDLELNYFSLAEWNFSFLVYFIDGDFFRNWIVFQKHHKGVFVLVVDANASHSFANAPTLTDWYDVYHTYFCNYYLLCHHSIWDENWMQNFSGWNEKQGEKKTIAAHATFYDCFNVFEELACNTDLCILRQL